jgi:hypothetical protein
LRATYKFKLSMKKVLRILLGAHERSC